MLVHQLNDGIPISMMVMNLKKKFPHVHEDYLFVRQKKVGCQCLNSYIEQLFC